MKKVLQTVVSILFASTFFLSSCKKDDSKPDNAPKLKAGTTTTFSVNAGQSDSWILTDDIEDPQGDTWVVSSVTSSNSNILAASTGSKNNQAAFYEGIAAGTVTLTIVITDRTGASRTITGTINVLAPVEASAVSAE